MPEHPYFGHNIGNKSIYCKKNMISPVIIGGFVEMASKTLITLFCGTPCKCTI